MDKEVPRSVPILKSACDLTAIAYVSNAVIVLYWPVMKSEMVLHSAVEFLWRHLANAKIIASNTAASSVDSLLTGCCLLLAAYWRRS